MAIKDDFNMLTSTERIKLEQCAVRDGMRRGMKEAEESSLLPVDLVLRAESQGWRPSCE